MAARLMPRVLITVNSIGHEDISASWGKRRETHRGIIYIAYFNCTLLTSRHPRTVISMFNNLSQRFSRIIKDLRGQGRITEEHIDTTLREVRLALLEADVALPVVRAFTEHVRQRALGTEVIGTLTPGQAVIRIVR